MTVERLPTSPGPSATGRWAVPISDVVLPPAAVAAVVETLESGWLSTGPRIERFEAAMVEFLGGGEAVACSSGTAALHLALAALGIGPGDEVIVPSMSFVATANAVRYLGAEPIFADITSLEDPTLAPASVRAALSPQTAALIVMHYAGYPVDDELFDIAGQAGIPVVEDAAHALGARTPRGPCGLLGTAGCFSFYANKNLPLGEGGMVVTRDADLAAHVRSLRSHAMTSGTWARHHERSGDYDVTDLGFNYRMDEAHAALGAALLRALPEGNERRRAATDRYRDRLEGVATVSGVGVRAQAESADHLLALALPTHADRRAVRELLANDGVQTSVHYPPIHRLSAFAAHSAALPVTEEFGERELTLPLYPHITSAQIDRVTDALRAALVRGGGSARREG